MSERTSQIFQNKNLFRPTRVSRSVPHSFKMKKNILYKVPLVARAMRNTAISTRYQFFADPAARGPSASNAELHLCDGIGCAGYTGRFCERMKNKTQNARQSINLPARAHARDARERKRQRKQKHRRTSFFLEKFHVTNPNAPRATNPANVLRLHAFGSANHPPYVVQTCPRIDRGSWCAGAPCPPIFVRSLSSFYVRARPASCGRLT